MNATLLGIKQRFGIIGNSELLNRAIDVAMQVAPTDLSVLITGESGSGKEVFPKIIHALSTQKHNQYIAVNCGAIPEGTIDSELFGHEKGSFTGAIDSRKGYFEEANGGTIFLDEVGELPMSTQARLLRVLESGEFLKVGSSKVLKTTVRIIAATNVNITEAIKKGKFREDLYYRLNTIPIIIPPLRNRNEDIFLLFKKFAIDLAEKYHMPPIKLTPEAQTLLLNYRWPGNIRQLKNIAEQISVIEENRIVDENVMRRYLPESGGKSLPVLYENETAKDFDSKLDEEEFKKERELFYKVLFEMKTDINELKKIVVDIMQNGTENMDQKDKALVQKIYSDVKNDLPVLFNNVDSSNKSNYKSVTDEFNNSDVFDESHEFVEESFSIADKEKELILKSLQKHKGKRKSAAKELGISERTLYRKIKEYNINS
jgi:transcriptional regulator with PAS, ATPase and Fis domain